MNVIIKGRIAAQIKEDLGELHEIVQAIEEEGTRRRGGRKTYDSVDLDLAKLTRAEVEKLRDVLATSGIQGTKVIAADITKYLRAELDGIDSMTARTVRQAAWMLEHYIGHLPHHLIFSTDDYEGGSHVGYFVEDVEYKPRSEGYSGRSIPEHVVVSLAWIENDARKTTTVDLYDSEVLDRGAVAILAGQGYVPEKPFLVRKLEEETARYYELRGLVGKKFIARGIGKADLDDASATDRHVVYMSSRRMSKQLRLDNFGVQTPVVIDVLAEGDSKEESDRDARVNLYRWHPWNLRYFSPAEDDLARHLEADEDTDFHPEIQVPVHPLVPCFDLKRHVRLRCHVNNLTEYVYRREVASGLVIPERDRKLINLLIDQSSNTFKDVVEGKGQSMNVLSGGPPGTGKTLSAEVFAEAKGRPLYTVQCSQLGIDPSTIEKNLAVILQRANRWNAILLLDEADVYIRERGADLKHNAIVGVFLRMIEYAQCILFMTTNLPDNVDDAIASRCIVRINYGLPDAESQARIWRQLADLNALKLKDAEIAKFVRKHPSVSGRDVKNLLKLASFIAQSEDSAIDAHMLEYALQYKPTASIES